MNARDHRGLSLSAGTPRSIERYEQALGLLQIYSGNPLAIIEETLAEDPTFIAGHALRAALMVTTSERRALPELQKSVEAGEQLIARGAGNERERAQLAAARAWLDGDFELATDRYNRVSLEHPRDALALQVSHLCNFFLGRSTWLRDHVAAALPHLTPGEPLYGYAQGMLAFGLEECHEFERAEAAGLTALECDRRDTWAVHAVAHCHEMRGKPAQGIAWLAQREADWAPENFFAVHNYWHWALYHLELGEVDPVLALYDHEIRGSNSEVVMDLLDASAMLWRLLLSGVDVRERFVALADVWRRIEEHDFYGFNDWHALMAYAGAGARADVQRVLSSLERQDSPLRLAPHETRQACRGFAAFAEGDYARAVEVLFPLRTFAQRFGGSHAQRDILDWTLLEAALRDKQLSFARALAEVRRDRKPSSPAPLRLLARGYAEAGALESAADARQQAEHHALQLDGR
ncbi:MAG TPA: tetratricopeptide repeat protein [Polyangiales bacterium]|nr:tetratricopeptide repeat protein [Polyangiales bacterium]